MSCEELKVPVITVDGPSGSGKGTICKLLAQQLGWHLLDSGALYRLTALAARHHGVALDDTEALVVLAGHLDVQFVARDQQELQVILEGEEVTGTIRHRRDRWCRLRGGCATPGAGGAAEPPAGFRSGPRAGGGWSRYGNGSLPSGGAEDLPGCQCRGARTAPL